MSEHNDEAPEEPMLFGIPLSMFPRTPAREEREPTLWELFMLGWWPLDLAYPLKWIKRRRARRWIDRHEPSRP
jgi:hypothetical protein